LRFNPRSREGSDDSKVPGTQTPDMVSIHAPVKGATKQDLDGSSRFFRFNPRSREGSDL